MVSFAEEHKNSKQQVGLTNQAQIMPQMISSKAQSMGEHGADEAAQQPEVNFTTIEQTSARILKTQSNDGQSIYIKYPLNNLNKVQQISRKFTTATIRHAFWRPLPYVSAEERNILEVAKLKKFATAGLAVPDILAEHSGFNIFVDTGKNIDEILQELRKRDVRLHDNLLTRCAEAMGQVHAAGLCQGWPDLHDLFLAKHGVGFSGFQEYPEKFMPMSLAQVRDIWFLLNLITTKAVDKDKVLATGFLAWRRQVGLETLESLRASIRPLRYTFKPYKLFATVFLGKTGRNKLRVMRFLVSNLGV